MNIIQITPGIIPIPPNGWGAVEKIIWEYKKSLDKIGYNTQILYTDDVKKEDNQIVHVHMANLANILNSRGIEYVFSLHDHHVEFFGKDSQCYKENYNAIKNSKLTFVHSKHLIDFFDNLPQIKYLPHGANLKDYQFTNRSKIVKTRPIKLVMMGNNGISGDKLSDRKGFLLGIDAAKQLGLEISIICPGSNKEFFEHHRPNYERLSIIYDLPYKESIDKIKEFDIFIHPSNLEAGHPNLTITESLSMGIPVVGTSNIHMCGMIRVERNVNDLVLGIQKCIQKYDSLVSEIEENRYLLSWDIIASKMLQFYKTHFNISEKQQLIHNYTNTPIRHTDKQNKNGIIVEFKQNRAFIKTSFFSNGATVLFKDKRTNKIHYHTDIGKQPGQWAYIYSPENEFIDWDIILKQGRNVIYSECLDLNNKKVLLTLNNISETLKELIKDFIKETNCSLTIKSKPFDIDNCCFDEFPDPEYFYFSINEKQLIDYFRPKYKLKDSEILVVASNAIGDTIAFIPYAQSWANKNNKKIDVAINHSDIFNNPYYINLNILDKKSVDLRMYTDISIFEYIFDKPLQRGYSDQFGIEYEEIRPKIACGLSTMKEISELSKKYVCIGVHTTSQCKYWNYPNGWEIITQYLKKMGYEVIALDLYEVFGIENNWNYLPESAIKKTGMPLKESISYLKNCEFFIGVSSGLSWVAHALGKKTIMISGTTLEDNEFTIDNYRVINKKVCNGCFNQTNFYKFNPGDWLWCPVNKGTDKQFECSKSITPDMVIENINKIIYNKKSIIENEFNK